MRDLRVTLDAPVGTIRALDGVSFDVRRGEIVAMIGESGAGKSTLGMSIVRLVTTPGKTSGQIVFDGRDLVAMPEAELAKVRGSEISVVLQDPSAALNPVLTIGDQINEVLRYHTTLERGQRRQRVVEALEQVGIAHAAERLNRYPHEFSGGMQQRVMIAMALACEPKMIVADEPTSALDVTTQARLLELFAGIADDLGIAVLVITHDPSVARSIAERVVVLYAGSIVERGPADAVLDSPRHPYTAALLRARPRLDVGRDVPLETIPGRSPDMRTPPSGCVFYARCPYQLDQRCVSERPPLHDVGGGHFVASFYDAPGVTM